MKKVPFYANHEDNQHCMLAAYRSIFDHFLHKKMTWPQLEAFTGFKPDRTAWTLKSLVRFSSMGFDIRMIEPFDYKRYQTVGERYLYELFPSEKADWFRDNTNLEDMRTHIPDFLRTIDYEYRRPALADIDDMLADDRLVFVTVNGRQLNGQDGFVSHILLVIDADGDDYVAHDPGLPPQPDRRIPRQQLWQAMGGDSNTAGVTGFKLKERRNLRLDHYVIGQFPLLSRSYAVKLINEGKVLVNGQTAKPGYKLRERDDITIDYDESDSPVIPDIDLPVLYEDDDCIVIDKPAGVLTHSVGKLIGEATVASFLRSRLHAPRPGDEGVAVRNAKVDVHKVRAGIVHRLDRATSGIIICAKTPQALAWLQRQFHDREVEKTYVAAIAGQLDPPAAVIDMPIERNPRAPATFRVGANGKPAITRYKTLEASGSHSLLELKPQTGRTHQLRVHLAHQNHPIVGDYFYGGQKAGRLYLHAYQLSLTLPDGQRRTFTAELPPEFKVLINSGSGGHE